MIVENNVGKHAPEIVGAIFRRFGPASAVQEARSEVFVMQGTIKRVEIARRNFRLDGGDHQYCISWDGGTEFRGTAVAEMHGAAVVVHARANIVGLHAASVIAVNESGGESDLCSPDGRQVTS